MTNLDATVPAAPESSARNLKFVVRNFYLRRRQDLMLVTLVLMLVGVFMAPVMVYNIPAGHAGVIWRRFAGGTDVNKVLTEGVVVIWPWDRLTTYDMRVKVGTYKYEAIAQDGLHFTMNVAFRYRLTPQNVGYMHKLVGQEFADILLIPGIGSIVRRESAKYTAHEIYGEKRAMVQEQIFDGVVDSNNYNFVSRMPSETMVEQPPVTVAAAPTALPKPAPAPAPAPTATDNSPTAAITGETPTADQDSFIELKDLLISEVVLPDRVRAAIEGKEEQQQLAKEYQFRLERERLESQRKVIEAEGIRNFQDIVRAGISENYLRWRGIEATLRLASSPNSKIIVIGGQGGLPLILNTGDTPGPVAPNATGKAAGKPVAADQGVSGSLDVTLPDGILTNNPEEEQRSAQKSTPAHDDQPVTNPPPQTAASAWSPKNIPGVSKVIQGVEQFFGKAGPDAGADKGTAP